MQIRAGPAKRVEPAFDLQVERSHVRGQQAMEVEYVALSVGERRAFVQERIVQQLVAAQRGFDDSR